MTTLELPEIVLAEPSHAGAVGAMLFDFNTEFGSETPSAGEFVARFERLLVRDDVLVVLAGPAVGFAFLTLRPTPYGNGPLAQLEELYVRPESRGNGIGSAILVRLMEEISARGAIEIHINVDEVDTAARRFYEQHGFTNVQPGADYRMLCYLLELHET